MKLPASRVIIHVDMDAFFAAVEQRDRPELRGKPVIIGGDPRKRGVVSTASYEARRFGVHSAMPLGEAVRRCPQGVFLSGDHAKYHRVSEQLRGIFLSFTPLVEPISLDEAFLDVSGSLRLFGDGPTIGRAIQEHIRQKLDLAASVGIAPNKFLAKLASDLQKPNGFVVVPDDGPAILEFLRPLAVARIWGVGPVLARQLEVSGYRTVGALSAVPLPQLERRFGKVTARHLFLLARGIDERPVTPEYEAKSVGRETTFFEDISDRETILAVLHEQADEVASRLRRAGLGARTVTIKLRSPSFVTITRRITLAFATDVGQVLYRQARELFLASGWTGRKLRLVGVSASNFACERGDIGPAVPQAASFRQPALWDTLSDGDANLAPNEEGRVERNGEKQRERERALEIAVDRLREKHGRAVIRRASLSIITDSGVRGDSDG